MLTIEAPLHSHKAFYIAAGIAVAAFLGALWVVPGLAVTIGANTFFVVYLLLVLTGIPKLTPAYLKRHAGSADEPVWIIFLVTFGAVVVALASLFILLNRNEAPSVLDLSLTLAAVALGWFTIHTMAALHYAHLYWQPETTPEGAAAHERSQRGGLEFPGKAAPGGLDFLYFAYVIGMTAQTSDTAVTTPAMRFPCLVHSVVSFFFNTVLVAAAVNVVVSLGN